MRSVWMLACAAALCGCPGQKAKTKAVAKVKTECALAATEAPNQAADDALLAVAAQYFHAGHIGGFDAYRGGTAFPWFDEFDLTRAVMSPKGSRIAASTDKRLIAVDDAGTLIIIDRATGKAERTKVSGYPEEAIELDGSFAVLGRASGGWFIAHFASGSPTVRKLAVPERTTPRIVATADSRAAVLWSEAEGTRFRLLLSWGLQETKPIVVDEVELPAPVAALAAITRAGVVAAADGDTGLGVAWRPITDRDLTDVGSRSRPPRTAAKAQVRWFAIEPGKAPSAFGAFETEARPLGFTTGIGPWPLDGNGLTAGTMHGRATFAWNEAGEILAVRAGPNGAPTRLGESHRAPLLSLWPSGEATELRVFESPGRIRALTLACSDPKTL